MKSQSHGNRIERTNLRIALETRACFFLGGELEFRVDVDAEAVADAVTIAGADVVAFSSLGGRELIEAETDTSEIKVSRSNLDSELTNTTVRWCKISCKKKLHTVCTFNCAGFCSFTCEK